MCFLKCVIDLLQGEPASESCEILSAHTRTALTRCWSCCQRSLSYASKVCFGSLAVGRGPIMCSLITPDSCWAETSQHWIYWCSLFLQACVFVGSVGSGRWVWRGFLCRPLGWQQWSGECCPATAAPSGWKFKTLPGWKTEAWITMEAWIIPSHMKAAV